ncbi:Crp/Fnr family transcriptional regulator [Solidesulfovibrio sp.]|jgi:CRP-like cAMP-binding protein|uniref:Crp/Fnr family transcriptional regulator n=1 Tax=Solidesulfovibrio sp. TaxID=2910990 RepID=UPI002B1ED0EF|nr:Crp/Fnr family transcriptional regulator [Solidesulfovibrio sp.]MEA5089469.1 Crp/Fnr family transcriptional regulator [Solidesulfovibrio sp.]HML59283.1 Crp/Fnr family transcriptional regulator [Solidesulfovibrio sp.]
MKKGKNCLLEENKSLEFVKISSVAGAWRQVLHYGKRCRFPKGAEILPGGTTGEHLFFIDQGEVRLQRITRDGREKLLLSLHPGAIVGETPFFDEVPSCSTIVAATDCVLYSFSKDCVVGELIPRYPALAMALLQTLAAKVRVLCNQSVRLSLDDLPSRICTFLHLRAHMLEDGSMAARVSPGLNQQELANLLGVHRVTLNKALRELERESILGPYTRDEVYILDDKRFQELILK